MQTNLHEAIADGYYAAKHGSLEDFAPEGVDPTRWSPTPPSQHPNRTMLVADDKQWVVERKVMDPSFGDRGFVRFAIRGTAAEASALANTLCEHINMRYLGPPRDYDSKIIRLARDLAL